MSLSVLAGNMPFVVSLLWLFYHTVMFTIPLLWAFAVATARPGSSPPGGAAGGFTVSSPRKTGPAGPPDTPRTAAPAEVSEKGSLGCLGLYSYLAWALCWAAVLLVAIACLGIGDGTIGSWAVSHLMSTSGHLLFLLPNFCNVCFLLFCFRSICIISPVWLDMLWIRMQVQCSTALHLKHCFRSLVMHCTWLYLICWLRFGCMSAFS